MATRDLRDGDAVSSITTTSSGGRRLLVGQFVAYLVRRTNLAGQMKMTPSGRRR